MYYIQETEEVAEEESDHWDTLLQSESESESSLQPRQLHKDFLNALGETSMVRYYSRMSHLQNCMCLPLLVGTGGLVLLKRPGHMAP